jgi:hypothetical protein
VIKIPSVIFYYRSAFIYANACRKHVPRNSFYLGNKDNLLGEGHFGFRRGRQLGMLSIISEQILEIDEKLCSCFID